MYEAFIMYHSMKPRITHFQVFQATFLIIIVLKGSHSDPFLRIKRAQMDNFNVLLNIYKMNPLKKSDLYKKFSNQMLLPRSEGSKGDLNFNSIESGKEIQKGTKKSDEIAGRTVNANKLSNNFTRETDLQYDKECNELNERLINKPEYRPKLVTQLFPIKSLLKFGKKHFHSFSDGDLKVKDLENNDNDGTQDADTVVMK